MQKSTVARARDKAWLSHRQRLYEVTHIAHTCEAGRLELANGRVLLPADREQVLDGLVQQPVGAQYLHRQSFMAGFSANQRQTLGDSCS